MFVKDHVVGIAVKLLKGEIGGVARVYLRYGGAERCPGLWRKLRVDLYWLRKRGDYETICGTARHGGLIVEGR